MVKLTHHMQKYKLYLFDFDGTLVDSHHSLEDVFYGAYKAIGVTIDKTNTPRYARQPLEVTSKEVNAPDDPKSIEIFISEIRRLLDDKEVLKKTRLYPETLEVLKYFNDNNIPVGIVTSNNAGHVKDVLDFFDIAHDTFSIYVDSDEIRETKPSPKPILRALEKFGPIDLKDVCYVGDALNDALAAERAHVTPILLDRDNSYPSEKKYIKIVDLRDLIK